MKPIKLLPEDVRCLIGAGEVVERPRSVVKELVENALDAEATRIELTLSKGGLSRIQVRDNGWGMDADDLRLCWQRHATSKIETAQDLKAISSFGFRGEALAAIAAVSRLTITSRKVGEITGHRLAICGGQMEDLQEAGTPTGTLVTVEDLFFNTPVRRKTLASATTELRHVLRIVEYFAYVYPGCGFRLTNDSREVFHSLPGQGETYALASLFGDKADGRVAPVTAARDGFSLQGHVTVSAVRFPDRRHMHFFVNARPVRSPLLTKAVESAFCDLLPKGTYPGCLLKLRLPNQEVDPNIHPRKEEVKIIPSQEVFQFVRRALIQAMAARPSPPIQSGVLAGGGCRGSWHDSAPKSAAAWRPAQIAPPEQGLAPASVREEASPYAAQPPLAPSARYRVVGQLHALFLLVEDDAGLLIVDQHALHERVLLERWRKRRSSPAAALPLLHPIILRPSKTLGLFLKAQRDVLRQVGFDVEPLAKGEFIVRTLPELKGSLSPEGLTTFLEEISESPDAPDPRRLEEEAIKRLACRQAVRGGDLLSREEMEALVAEMDDLMQITPSIFACAHGRPTVHRMSRQDLCRLFERPVKGREVASKR